MKDVAYIVSCSDYEDSTIGNLNYADADAKNIKDIFEKELGIKDIRSLTPAKPLQTVGIRAGVALIGRRSI